MENVQNAAHLVLEVTEMSKNQSVNFSVKVSTKDVNYHHAHPLIIHFLE